MKKPDGSNKSSIEDQVKESKLTTKSMVSWNKLNKIFKPT